MNFFKDYRKRLAWFGILLVAIVLSQTPMALLGLLAQTEIPSIWSGIKPYTCFSYLFVWRS